VAVTRRGSLKLLNDPVCGIAPFVTYRRSANAASATTLLVTNGDQAADGQFPWMASLLYRRTNRRFAPPEHKCGGTLVKDR
jgi:hypothetical protein